MREIERGEEFSNVAKHSEIASETPEQEFEGLSNALEKAVRGLETSTVNPKGAEKDRLRFGGKAFGDNIMTQAQEYAKMFYTQRGELSPTTKNEAEGMVKYFEQAEKVFQRAQQESREADTLSKSKEIRPGEMNVAYYETFQELETSANELLLASMVEKYNALCSPEDRFDLNFPHAADGNQAQKGFQLFQEYARFIKHAKGLLEANGTNTNSIAAAEKAFTYAPIYSGIKLEAGAAVEYDEDAHGNVKKQMANVREFNGVIPKDASGQFINWLPLWLRQQALFRQEK